MFMPLVDQLLDLALLEDMAYGDITSEALFDPTDQVTAHVVCRQSAIISGVDAAEAVFRRVDPNIEVIIHHPSGDAVPPNTPIITVSGSRLAILKAERLALNLLQHLSGVATLTYQYVGAVSGTGAEITHTRKTLPGLRQLQIEAVLHGGGSPHRKSLSHAALIKDNHIAGYGGIAKAVQRLREQNGHMVKIEVECDTLDQVTEALDAGVDLILLDNMPLPALEKTVHQAKGKAVLEASGGITLRNVLTIAKTGVDYISTSEITLSAPAVDMGLDILESSSLAHSNLALQAKT